VRGFECERLVGNAVLSFRSVGAISLLLVLCCVRLSAQRVCEECWALYNSINAPFRYDFAWSMAMDSVGNIWMGDGGGLIHRFDGAEWKMFDLKPLGVPNSPIQGLAIDPKGILWMAVEGKLVRWDGGTKAEVVSIDSTYGLETAIAPDGTILFGTHYQGIYTYNDGVIKHLWGEWEPSGSGHGMEMWHVSDMEFDSRGELWFGTRRGVWHYDGTTFHQYDTGNSAIRDPVNYNLIFDREGTLWTAGMPPKNLCRLRDGEWEEFVSIGRWMETPFKSHPLDYRICRIVLLRDGGVLVGGQFTSAISIYRHGVWYQPGIPERLRGLNWLGPSVVDRRGRVWMRTDGAASVVMYDPARDRPRADTTVPPPVRWPAPSAPNSFVPGITPRRE